MKLCECGHDEEMHKGLRKPLENGSYQAKNRSCRAETVGTKCPCEEFKEDIREG